ncbi:MAG TPA: hypothetical protein VHZ73_13865 [Vicinamibacterales bacterium]|jgi:outer membrane protein W|nr:hypothetical protein [Vicinamibacterales bacterium]
MRRLLCSASFAMLAVTLVPAPAHAQQSFNFYIGEFVPKGLDSRDVNDVLLNDTSFLDYNFRAFRQPTIGAEWLVDLGDKTEAGLGVGYYEHTAPAVDAFSVFDTTGAPIAANLRLRTVPFTATFRFLPMGHGNGIEPYIGAGITAISYKYSETGNFVATDGVSIVNGRFVGSGGAVGPVILGGVRFPFGPLAIGGEVRWQSATGKLPDDQNFAASTPTSSSRIDLGGVSYLMTFNVRF